MVDIKRLNQHGMEAVTIYGQKYGEKISQSYASRIGKTKQED